MNHFSSGRQFFRVALASASFILCTPPQKAVAQSSELAPFFVEDDEPETLRLSGPLEYRSALTFQRALDQHPSVEVIDLDSPGGDVYEALMIARLIHDAELSTRVSAESECTSACSFLFFAGIDRQLIGKLGVHQISSTSEDLNSGQVAIADILEALDRFDVPDDIVQAMLRTPPDQMYYFTGDAFTALGVLGPPSATEPSMAHEESTPAERPRPDFYDAAEFLVEYNRAWSRTNDLALPQMELLFDRSVDFYGSIMTSSQVLAEKAAFARRWPARRYFVEPMSVTGSCDRTSRCRVESEVLWDVSSPEDGRHSSGRATFILDLVWQDGRFLIDGESGEVLERY